MRRFAISMGLVMLACAAPDTDVAPTAMEVPRDAAIFAPGVISTTAPEFSITLTPGGDTAYFTLASENRDTLTIMESTRVGGAWTEPRVAPFSGEYRDLDPFVTADGNRLYFSSTRPTGAADATTDLDTWYVERVNGTWSAPVRMAAPYNTDSTEVFVSATRDGTLFFQSNRQGGGRVWSVAPDGRARIVALDSAGLGRGGNPLVSADGAFLLLVGNAGGGPDLFFACRAGDGFGTPHPLARVNSTYADFAPALSPDGRTLFFTSERPGQAPARTDDSRPPGDIWSIALDAAGVECDAG